MRDFRPFHAAINDLRTARPALSGVGGLLCLVSCLLIAGPAFAQSVPEERRITHREKSLGGYNPFEAEELWERIEIPPAPALSPQEALESFKLAPGFRIECVAAEPLVVDPVMFEFDADGRIWVVEMRGWMLDLEGTGEGDPIGQVVVLEDTDGDTVMDKSTVFLDKLVMPRTVSFVQGGVLVAEPPNLWYCQDEDGDLQCDSKQLVGQYGRPGNPEHTDNSLFHAIDNWMYSAKTDTRHRFRNGELIEDENFFRGQWGMTQDDYGRLFYNYQNSSLHCDVIPATYMLRNRHLRSMRGLNVNIATEAHEVFPIRVTPGITLGATELRDDGTLRTFTIASGLSIYRGDQYPEQYYGGAVIPEAGGNLVRFDQIASDGIHLKARNAFGRREWLASTDERFRPVWSRTGPDGAVYIGDLYRGIIEHVIYMMPYLRKQILSRDLHKPTGLGRIYRIVHEDKPLGRVPKMSRQNSLQLVEHLSHPNGWWRDTAQRLLVQRQALDAADRLDEVALNGSAPLGRLHALWTLEGIGALDWETVDEAMGDQDAMVRATAIRLSEHLTNRPDPAELFGRLQDFVSDERPMVRLQLMLTLGAFIDPGAAYAADEKEQPAATGPVVDAALRQMAAILIAQPSELFSAAAISGLEGRELEMLARLLEHPDWSQAREQSGGALQTLAQAVMNEGQPRRIEKLLELAAAEMGEHPWQTEAIAAGVLQSELARTRWPKPVKLARRPELLTLLKKSSPDGPGRHLAPLQRIVTWPGDTTEREMKPVLKPLTAEQQQRLVLGQSVYEATCFACHKSNGQGQAGMAPPLSDSEWVHGPADRLVRIVLQGLRGPIEVRGQTWDLEMPPLGHSPILNDERLAGVLTYVRRAWGNYGDAIDPELVAEVRQDTAGRTALWTVEELLDPEQASAAPVMEADPLAPYRDLLDEGDPRRGEKLFHVNMKIRCNACHTVGSLGGGFVGPDLTDIGSRGTRDYLLESLISPSAKIAEGFETLVVLTNSGQIVSGVFVSEDDKQVVLAPPAGGTVAIPVAEIEERIQSPVSSMPPMGRTFGPQEIADLVAYLVSLKAAGRPPLTQDKALGEAPRDRADD